MTLPALTRSGAALQIAGVNRRLSGLNAYWLGLDDNAGVNLPNHATITAAFDGMQAMHCTHVRAHTVGISAGTSLSYLTGYLGTAPVYVEANMDSADWAVYQAGLHGIYLMCPLTDNWNYYHGGLWNFVHWAYQQNSTGITDVDGSIKDDPNNRQFFANTAPGLRIRALFKAYITRWLNHVNPYTGLAYKDDPTIAIVETGNEIYYAAQLGSNEWTQDIASTVKSIAPGKLVADGSAASGQATSTMPGLTAAAVDIVGGHYYPQRASAGYTSQTFTSTDSSFPAGSAKQQLAADVTAASGSGKAFILGEYPWTRSDVAAWWSDIEANAGIDVDMAWSFIPGTEPHGGTFGSDDYPIHYPYLGATEQTYAPALATHISVMQTAASSLVSGPITRSGAQLLRNGSPFKMIGANIYNANSVNNYWYTLGTGTGLQQALTDLNIPGGVMRAWFGQWLYKPSGNVADWTVFDHTLNTAQANGWQVIPVFADQDGTWDDGIRKTLDSQWYQSGYKTQVSTVASSWGAVNTMTYKDWVLTFVNRYKGHPAIAFWQLINEVEPKPVDETTITSALEDTAQNILRAWADDMAAAIKTADPNHLISLGTIDTGQFGTSGPRYQVVHGGPNIDLCEMHDYVASQDIIGDQFNGMQLRLNQAAALNKPLFVGETGIDPNAVGGLTARASRFQTKWAAQKTAGVQGWLPWEWRNSGQTGGDTYVFGPNDPMLPVLRALGASPGGTVQVSRVQVAAAVAAGKVQVSRVRVAVPVDVGTVQVSRIYVAATPATPTGTVQVSRIRVAAQPAVTFAATLEPFDLITLPGTGWTQTGGPTTAPGAPAPAGLNGYTLTYAGAGQATITVRPHTVYYDAACSQPAQVHA